MKTSKICVQLLHHLASINTQDFQLDSSAHLALHKKWWKTSSEGIDDRDICLDDVGAFSNTRERHLDLLDEILDCLTANGLQSTHSRVNGQFKKLIGLYTG